MGGKKQAQRTKGNTRPSSSARAAEMLAMSGRSVQGFIGFGNNNMTDSEVTNDATTKQATDECDMQLDGDLRFILKRLSKKDPTTRLKALQDLCQLCKEKDANALRAMLYQWSRLYNKLSVDEDRRVREAAQIAFNEIVKPVGRDLATHLKSFMGMWVLSQCDSFAPAASAARLAFQSAFPPAKQADAMYFCRDEIIQSITEFLFPDIPQTSSPSDEDAELPENKRQRYVSLALGATSLILTSLDKTQAENIAAKIEGVLRDPRFWKYGKDKADAIRSAFYTVISSFCQKLTAVACSFADKICSLVLYSVDDASPIVCRSLWECVLSVLSTIQDSWNHVNARKGMLPKLWSLFRSGCKGSASVIAPNLLPFLSQVPLDVIGEGNEFYNEWFNNMWQGLQEESVCNSRMEMNALVSSYVECLQYSIIRKLGGSDQEIIMAQKLTEQHLLPIVEESITLTRPTLANSLLYPQVVRLLISLRRQAESENESKRIAAFQLFGFTFDELSSLCMRMLKSCTTTNDHLLERIGLLLEMFCKSSKPTTSINKQCKVKFAGDDEQIYDVNINCLEANTPEKDLTCLFDRAEKSALLLSSECVLIFNASKRMAYLKLLFRLMKVYINKNFVDRLLSLSNMNTDSDNHGEITSLQLNNSSTLDNSIFICFKNMVFPWIHQMCGRPEQTNRCNTNDVLIIFDIVLLLYDCADCSRALIITNLLEAVDNIRYLLPVLQHVLHSLNIVAERNEVMTIFKSSSVTNLVENALNTVLHGEKKLLIEESYQLLVLLTTKHNNSYVLELKSLPKMLTAIKLALVKQLMSEENKGMPLSEFLLSLLNNLLIACKDNELNDDVMLFAVTMWQLCCVSSGNTIELLKPLWRSSWDYLLKTIDCDVLLSQICSEIKNIFSTSSTTNSRVKSITEMCLEIMEASVSYGKLSKGSICAYIINSLIPSDYEQLLVNSCLENLLLCDKLTFINQASSSLLELDTSKAEHYISFIAFCMHLVMTVCRTTNPSCASEPAESSDNLDLDAEQLLPLSIDKDLCQNLLLQSVLALAYCNVQTNLEPSPILDELLKILSSDIRELLHLQSDKEWSSVLNVTSQESRMKGGLWALCLNFFLNELSSTKHHINIETEIFAGIESWCQSEAMLQTVEQVLPRLSSSKLCLVAEVLGAQLLSCIDDIEEHLTDVAMYIAAFVRLFCLNDEEWSSRDVAVRSDVAITILDQLQAWKKEEKFFLSPTSPESPNTGDQLLLSFNVSQLNFLTSCVQKIPTRLSRDHWDHVLCSAVKWIQYCSKPIMTQLNDPFMRSIAVAASHLISNVADCMTNVVAPNITSFPDNLLTEWQELFSPAIFGVLLPLFIQLANDLPVDNVKLAVRKALLPSVGLALSRSPQELLMCNNLLPKLTAGDTSSAPEGVQTLLNHLCPLITSQCRPVQITAFKLLEKVVPALAKFDDEQLKSGNSAPQQQEEAERSPIRALVNLLERSSRIVDEVLDDVAPECAVVIDPEQLEEFSGTFAYLLTWKLLLSLISSSPAELRTEYSYFLRHHHFIDTLLKSLFHLMPENPVIELPSSTNRQSGSLGLSATSNMFSDASALNILGNYSSVELQHTACRVYYDILCELPAVTRHWWNGLNKKAATLVNEYTMKFASPVLCAKEIQRIQTSTLNVENLSVRARPTTREVIATYSTDELNMELVITLAVNHPLGAVTVTTEKRVGVTSAQWNTWMLQMTTFLMHQNGSILDGILMWKRNVDKRFEGVEECTICFHVVHSTNNQLPKLQCRTCKKKYHSACLYKWFSTSNKSTCPLCRNLF